jgi:tRNA wybutosine-synthesizing protein 4
VSSFPETSAYGPPQSPTISKSLHAEVVYSETANAHGYRRFSAVLPVRSPTGLDDRVGNFAGMGLNNRLASYDVYSTDTIRDQPFDFIGSSTPSSRMCHTITDIGDAGALLVGGRTSPDNALSDCWVYHKWPRVWERVDDLPQPRYRHSAIYLGSGSVLISPGRSDSRSIGSTFFIWNRRFGWKKCACSSNEMPRATYGATFTVFTNSSASEQSISGRGLLAGGISEDGVVQQEIWEWELQSSFLGQVSRITRFFFPHPELDNHPA